MDRLMAGEEVSDYDSDLWYCSDYNRCPYDDY